MKIWVRTLLFATASSGATHRVMAFTLPGSGTARTAPPSGPCMSLGCDIGCFIAGQRVNDRRVMLLFADSSDGEEFLIDTSSSNGHDHGGKKKASVARVGGRRSGVSRSNKNSSKEVPGLVKFGALAAVAVFLLQAFLGWFSGGTSPSYVYYQSSIYESRTLGTDGQMETTRKESVRTNVPSLISGDREDYKGRKLPTSSFLLESPDSEIDKEIDGAIRRSMEMEKSFRPSMLDDFSMMDDFF